MRKLILAAILVVMLSVVVGRSLKSSDPAADVAREAESVEPDPGGLIDDDAHVRGDVEEQDEADPQMASAAVAVADPPAARLASVTVPAPGAASVTPPVRQSQAVQRVASMDLPSVINPYPRISAPVDRASVTYHQMTIGRETVNYRAITGYMPLTNERGSNHAKMFFTAYTRLYAHGERPPMRPLAFAFNGGPGAASLWLHFALGPRRVVLTEAGRSLPPPYSLTPNLQTWIPFMDLVFVDAVGTGYSRPRPGASGKEFYGMQKDVQAASQFVRLYVTRFEKWATPLFIVGESFGALRAVGMSSYLQEYHGIDLSGLILVSYPVDFRFMFFRDGDDLPYALFLPSYTTTAIYHGRLSPELAADPARTLNEVEDWALSEYLVALAKGDRLLGDERRRILEQMSRYTGLPVDYLDRENLRVTNREFIDRLLEDQGLSVGWQDGRFTTPGPYEIPFSDPSMIESTGPFVATWNKYVREELKFTDSQPYEFVSRAINMRWDWGTENVTSLNFYQPMRDALHRNRHLEIMVAGGVFDLNTPYFGSFYGVSHVGLHPSLHKNIHLRRYPGGHQMYLDSKGLADLRRDASSFVSSVLGAGGGEASFGDRQESADNEPNP